jgi:hypothetical protein
MSLGSSATSEWLGVLGIGFFDCIPNISSLGILGKWNCNFFLRGDPLHNVDRKIRLRSHLHSCASKP